MKAPELPNTENWQPRDTAKATIQESFVKRCIGVEKLITQRLKSEQEMNIDNYDSGSGFEDILREELSKMLPTRYSVDSGVVVDREGKTAGDCDIVIFNDIWFPHVKAAATNVSRRCFFPIEGIYSIGEIKQSLNYASLDDALKKLIICHRLKRPSTNFNRLIENRQQEPTVPGTSNPLYSFVIAAGLNNDISFEDLINRFFDINKGLKRMELVRALCVLGHGTVTWCYKQPDTGEIKPALFMGEDLGHSLFPGYQPSVDTSSSLFSLISNLMLHLYHSVLAPEDLATWYGVENRKIKVPESLEILVKP